MVAVVDDAERRLRELQERLERGDLTDAERLQLLEELTELAGETTRKLGEQLAALPWWVRMLLRLRRWRRCRPPRPAKGEGRS
jgi:hypothetical protein